MTWCNLYSAESKYKITLNVSAHARIWLFSQVFVLVLVLSFIFHLFFSYMVIFIALSGIIITVFYIYQSDFFFRQTSQYFTVDLAGYCQFSANDIWQLTPRSKLSYLGAYLHLEKIDPLTQKASMPIKAKQQFIYKDSVNAQDYARLCRVILKVKSLKIKN